MLEFGVFILLSIISVTGSIGNIFIIGAVCLSRRLRNRGNVFVVNLAAADLIITAYIMPVGLTISQHPDTDDSWEFRRTSGSSNQTANNEFPFGDAMCNFNAFVMMTTCGVSTQSLMMIAIERFCQICKPHLYERIYTKTFVGAMLVFTWVYTIVWTCQGWTGWSAYIYAESMYACIFRAKASFSYAVCLAVFGMVLPMIVLGLCYTMIFRAVRASRNVIATKKQQAERNPSDPTLALVYKQQKKKLAREQRLIATLFTIVVIFIVCWLPCAIVLTVGGIFQIPFVLYPLCIWLAFCNSAVNSVIYGVMNRNFRNGYITFFKCLFCGCVCLNSASGNKRNLLDKCTAEDSLSMTQQKNRSNSPENSAAYTGSKSGTTSLGYTSNGGYTDDDTAI